MVRFALDHLIMLKSPFLFFITKCISKFQFRLGTFCAGTLKLKGKSCPYVSKRYPFKIHCAVSICNKIRFATLWNEFEFLQDLRTWLEWHARQISRYSYSSDYIKITRNRVYHKFVEESRRMRIESIFIEKCSHYNMTPLIGIPSPRLSFPSGQNF